MGHFRAPGAGQKSSGTGTLLLLVVLGKGSITSKQRVDQKLEPLAQKRVEIAAAAGFVGQVEK